MQRRKRLASRKYPGKVNGTGVTDQIGDVRIDLRNGHGAICSIGGIILMIASNAEVNLYTHRHIYIEA